MLNDRKIGFIGAGNMAEAMIRGLLHSGASTRKDIVASEGDGDRRSPHPGRGGTENTPHQRGRSGHPSFQRIGQDDGE